MIKKSPYLILCLASVLLFGCAVKQNAEQFVDEKLAPRTVVPLTGITTSSGQAFPAFDSIAISGPYNVDVELSSNPYINPNGSANVSISGDSALVNYSSDYVNNHVFVLRFNPQYKYEEGGVRAKVVIYTSVPLRRIYYTGEGTVNVQYLNVDHFAATVNGSAYMFLAGAVNRLDATATGSSRLNAKCVIANSIFVNTTDLAQAEVLGGAGVSGLASGKSDIYYYSRPDMVAPYQRQSGSVMSMDGILPASTGVPGKLEPDAVIVQDTDFGIK
ncbi:MAG: GIN domain-containing protein [Gammaproteobacteria bacterium]